MEDIKRTSYLTTGSTWMSPVSDLVGVPLDQVNFLACQAFALVAALWFRLHLSPQNASPVVRHAAATLFGISFIVFCFGWYSAHVFILVFACYGIMSLASTHNVHRYSMIVAMGYLTVCQISRVIVFNYGILSTDFSGPLMIITQKVTTLAFQLHDGLCKKKEELTPLQRCHAVVSKPSLLEYLSYNLNFFSILVGPYSNYLDYVSFIEGQRPQQRLMKQTGADRPAQNGWSRMPPPSPVRAVINKLLVCAICMLLFLTITKAFPIAYNIDPRFINESPFLSRLAYAFISVQAARPKFYFAWTLADAVHNAAGYGVRVNEKGELSWDLVSNIHIWEIETANSFKTFIDNWNIQTGLWLKSVCYDRAPRYRTALTFILSALWHGVYPGYYFTFLTAIPITMAARAVRRNVRPYFLVSGAVKSGYDVLTWAATQLTICYTVMPFLLLAVQPTVLYYRSMYFHVHIISILAMVFLPYKPRSSKPPKQAQHSNNNVKEE